MEENGMKVIKIYTPKRKEKKETALLRVAAYCRVSSKRDEQHTSYDMQITVYRDKIEREPGWTLAGIYADYGLSGTRVPVSTRTMDYPEHGQKEGHSSFR